MTKRLLSLDGGGTWALVQVEALISLYGPNTRGHQVLRDFDLVIANSGGAIVVAALFEDLTLEAIRKLFTDSLMLTRLFSSKPAKGLRTLLKLMPRYTTQTKLAMLREFLPRAGQTPMHEVCAALGGRTHLLLIAFDYDSQRAVFTRSDPASPSQSIHDSPQQAGSELTLIDAVHGSSTPPVHYFDRPAATASERSRRLWDGALGGYNNPVVAGVCELLAQPEVRPESIEVLSIGTGQVRQFSTRCAQLLRAREPKSEIPIAAIVDGGDPQEAWSPWRSVKDLERMATSILDDPPDAATYVAFLMLGHKPPLTRDPADLHMPDLRLVRMNPVLCPVRVGEHWRMPTRFAEPRDITRLAALELDAHAARDVELIASFAQAWIGAQAASELPNQGVRQHWDSSLDLGDPTFAAAKQRWQALVGSDAHVDARASEG